MKLIPTPRRAVAPAILLGTLGCASGDADSNGPPAIVERRDSAGVEIVQSMERRWGPGEGWRVGEEPLLDLTGTGSGLEHEFYGVTDVARLPGGAIAVAMSTEIRVFTDEGRYLRTLGRAGEGPGEFERLMDLGVRADSLVAFDYRQRRVTVYAPELDLARVVSVPEDFLAPGSFGVTEQGFTAMELVPTALIQDTPPGLSRTPTAVLSISAEGAILDTLAVVAGTESFRAIGEGGPADIFLPFARQSYVAVHPDGVVVGDAVDLEFRLVAENGEVRRVVRGMADFAMTDEVLQAEKEATLGPEPSPSRRAYWEGLPAPERRPAYIDLQVDATGAVWLAEHRGVRAHYTSREPLSWEVFASDGVWLGQLRTPGRFTVHEIGADYVLGVQEDELDVEHVQMLPLMR